MENFRKIFSKITLTKNGKFLGIGSSPEADWMVILVTTVLFMIFAVAFSAYMFIKINKGEIFVIEKDTDDSSQTLDIALLRDVVRDYNKKALEFERFKEIGSLDLVDPSL